MTVEQLRKANEIKSKIDKLNDFIRTAEKVWTGNLSIRKPKLFFKSNSYGIYRSSELELDTETKDEILALVIRKRDNLLIELENIN